MIVAALAAMISASPAQAGGLKQVAEISIPGDPITDIGIMAIDQTTGLGYLADKTNKSVVVFDTKTDKFVARIPGFVGLLKDGNASGPNGVVVVGAEVWVSDGDSKIKLINTKTDQITGTVATGGTKRANGMALGEDIGVVIVANSNDDPPFLSFISTAPDHKILAKIPIPESGEPGCTPSRAALMTGQYSIRNGLSLATVPGSTPNTLSGKAYTMGQLFKDTGYATAIFGKWHLGIEAQSLPGAHGFDEFYGIPPDTSWDAAANIPQIMLSHSSGNIPEKDLIEKGPWMS